MLDYSFDPKTRTATYKGHSIQVPQTVGADRDGLYIIQRGRKVYLPPDFAFSGSPDTQIREDGGVRLINWDVPRPWSGQTVAGLEQRHRTEKVGWFRRRTVTQPVYNGEPIDGHWAEVMRMAVARAETGDGEDKPAPAAEGPRAQAYRKQGRVPPPADAEEVGDEDMLLCALFAALLIADFEEQHAGRAASEREVSDMVDRAIARGAPAPTDDQERHAVTIAARALTLDSDYIERLRARQKDGRAGMDDSDLAEARGVVQRMVEEFQRATGG